MVIFEVVVEVRQEDEVGGVLRFQTPWKTSF